MRFFSYLVSALLAFAFASAVDENCVSPSNQCVQFSVSQGTGCAWMCSYCANELGTNNYYFTDGVCKYEEGVGCVGNPIAGNKYSCCVAGNNVTAL